MPSPKDFKLRIDTQRGRDPDLALSLIKAEASALTKTAQQMRTFSKKELQKTFNVGDRALSRALSVSPASERKLFAVVRGSGLMIPLMAFGARKSRAGVSVEVSVGRRYIIPGTFIAKPLKGKNLGIKNVYIRQHYLDDPKKRYPIRRLLGPSVPMMFGSTGMRDKMETFFDENFERILEHEIDFYTGKTG